MNAPTPAHESSDGLVAEVIEPRAPRGSAIAPLVALFVLTLRQHCRGKRLIFLALVFALPAVLAVIVRLATDHLSVRSVEAGFVYVIISSALMPLAALLYACGMIGDEIEEQTLTYLLVRPLPKPMLYLVKLLATLLVTIVLTAVFTLATYAALYLGSPAFSAENIPIVAFQTVGIFSLALVAYCAIFGYLSLLTRSGLLIGVAYILLVEGLMGNIDFVARRLTVTYYVRVLEERWMDRFASTFELKMETVPTASTCVEILIGVSILATVISMWVMSSREFRMKTPQGS